METFKRTISVGLSAAMMIGCLSGCSLGQGNSAENMPLEPALTKQEVMDYYAKSMAYDTVISRNSKPRVNNYETTDVKDQDTLDIINGALDRTNELLNKDSYSGSPEDQQYLDESKYNYVKAMLNDKKIKNKKVESVKQALGYYFVDVSYDICAANTGTFKDSSSLVGLCGAFHKSLLNNTDSINSAFITTSVDKINAYYLKNNIDNHINYDPASSKLSISSENSNNSSNNQNAPETLNSTAPTSSTDTAASATNSAAPAATPTNSTAPSVGLTDISNQPTTSQNTDSNEDKSKDNSESDEKSNTVTKTSRTDSRKSINSQVDFDKIVGFGEERAYIPNLGLIYNTPSNGDGISGIGVYPSGSMGLSLFGFDRTSLVGTMKLRYVYKQDLVDSKKLSCTNIYTTHYEIKSGFNSNTENTIPAFLEDNFKVLIDRTDRAMMNNDISGLSNGDIFDDIGMAVLNGYFMNYSNLTRQISTFRRVISRDVEDNAYLIELETFRQEGAKSADNYGSYKDTVYAVVEQQGSKLLITDWMIMNRTLVNEPDINPYSATLKRIVSLGLSGEVKDDTKKDVTGLINDLYTASSNRILNGPKKTDDGKTIQRGMYDCFNSDVEMLSSSKKEKLNSKLRGLLVKYGTKTKSNIQGKVTEWIGGTNNQVEFMTEELISYDGKTDGVYLNCYYLVSSIEGKWVIDDMQILKQDELSGDAYNNMLKRFK